MFILIRYFVGEKKKLVLLLLFRGIVVDRMHQTNGSLLLLLDNGCSIYPCCC